MACFEHGGEGPPNTITDTSTLSVTIDNQGIATLQINILTKNKNPITNPNYTFNLNNATFRGFITNDNPRRLEGSDYFEHQITAKGMVC